MYKIASTLNEKQLTLTVLRMGTNIFVKLTRIYPECVIAPPQAPEAITIPDHGIDAAIEYAVV